MKNKMITALLTMSLLVSNAAIPVLADNESTEETTEIQKTAVPALSKFADVMDIKKSAGANDSLIFTVTPKGDESIPQPVVLAAQFGIDGNLLKVDKFDFTRNDDTYTATVDRQTGEYRLFVWTDDVSDLGEPITAPLIAADKVFGEMNYVSPRTQSIGLASVGNARELGGYATPDGKTVKRGIFLRTAALAGASDADIQRLKEVYNLAEVIDLRMSREIEVKADPVIDGVKNLWIGIIDEEVLKKRREELDTSEIEDYDPNDKMSGLKIAMKLGIVGEQMYINFLSEDQGKKGYKQMFDELLSLPEGKSLLFHCTQGKDRTGCAAMLILSALGVDEDTIMQDFLLTNVFNASLIENERKMLIAYGYEGEELETLMTCMDHVSEQYMQNALDWMKENYGSVTGYITEALGVTNEQLETLKNKYLK